VSKLLKNSQQTHNVPARYDPLCPQCLMTRTLEPSTSGTRTGRLAQALGMMSKAMHDMDELEASIMVESRSVQMVANLVEEVDGEEEEESLEEEEGSFEGDRHH